MSWDLPPGRRNPVTLLPHPCVNLAFDQGVVAIAGVGSERFTMTYWTTDPDGVFARAVAAGATPVAEVGDVFSGDRMGVVRDPAGIRWCMARHDRDVSEEEIAAAAKEWMAENA